MTGQRKLRIVEILRKVSQHQIRTREVLTGLGVDDYFVTNGLPVALKHLRPFTIHGELMDVNPDKTLTFNPEVVLSNTRIHFEINFSLHENFNGLFSIYMNSNAQDTSKRTQML